MPITTCDQCGHEAEPAHGQCAFCAHRMCGAHTIRTKFFGEWVSWCESCHARREANLAEHREGVGQIWDMIQDATEE